MRIVIVAPQMALLCWLRHSHRKLMAVVMRGGHGQRPHAMLKLASDSKIGRYQLASPSGVGAMRVVYQVLEPAVDLRRASNIVARQPQFRYLSVSMDLPNLCS